MYRESARGRIIIRHQPYSYVFFCYDNCDIILLEYSAKVK